MESTSMYQQLCVMNGRLESIDRSLSELVRILREINAGLPKKEGY